MKSQVILHLIIIEQGRHCVLLLWPGQSAVEDSSADEGRELARAQIFGRFGSRVWVEDPRTKAQSYMIFRDVVQGDATGELS